MQIHPQIIPSGGRTTAIVQARMGASRLPGKPLKKVLGKSLLSYQIERLRCAKLIDQIIIATSVDKKDDPIVALCQEENIPVFRGSECDVLDRYYQAALKFPADIIVRITGDCPIIDPAVVDRTIAYFKEASSAYDYVSNSLERTFPRGLDTEVFSFQALKRAAHEAKKAEEREHVTLYFYEHPEFFKLGSVVNKEDLSFHRWTVDTEEDFELISKIITALYLNKPQFTLEDVVQLLKHHPEWLAINAHVVQKPVR